MRKKTYIHIPTAVLIGGLLVGFLAGYLFGCRPQRQERGAEWIFSLMQPNVKVEWTGPPDNSYTIVDYYGYWLKFFVDDGAVFLAVRDYYTDAMLAQAGLHLYGGRFYFVSSTESAIGFRIKSLDIKNVDKEVGVEVIFDLMFYNKNPSW
jgi:hypothetical protein